MPPDIDPKSCPPVSVPGWSGWLYLSHTGMWRRVASGRDMQAVAEALQKHGDAHRVPHGRRWLLRSFEPPPPRSRLSNGGN